MKQLNKKKTKIEFYADKLANAFLKKKIIAPIPSIYSKKMSQAKKFKDLCESKIKKPVIGFKAGGTGLPMLKKLKEKEPFFAKVYSHNFLKNNKSVKINKYTLGIELEVCYKVKKNFFNFKQKITKNNIKRFILNMAPCIEIVGYRQRKKGLKTLGDLCSDFGANVNFIVGPQKKLSNLKANNLKTTIFNKKFSHLVKGNTNTVYVNPLNSLKFVLNKIQLEKINLNKNFYVFTGSTVGVVPIAGKGLYIGKIEKLGSVKTKII